MTDRQVEGVDLDSLEEFYKKFEDAVTAAIVAAMRASMKDGAVGAESVAAVSLDDLNVIPGQWARQVPALAENLAEIYVKSADMQADAFVRAGGVVTEEIADAVQSEVAKAVSRFTSEHEAAIDYLSQASNRLVGIGDELWADARAELLLGMDAGDSVPQLARRVREATGVTDKRARVIARSESVAASNGGSIAFMRSTGMVATKAWKAHFDERTRESHRVADGQEVDLGAKFVVGGALLDHPGDPVGPPAQTVQCRCVMLYGLTPDSADLAQSGDTLAASALEDAVTVIDETTEFDEAAALVAAMDPGNSAPWEGVICVTGTPTGDRRQFDSLTWADLPLPLRRNVVESHGGIPQTQAVLVGRIDAIEMRANEVWASGVIDLGSDAGRETARLMGTRESPGFLRGVSIDGDETPGEPSTIEYVFPDGCADIGPDADPAEMAACMEPELSIWSSARIRGATLTDIPALDQANLYLTDSAPAVVQPYPMAASGGGVAGTKWENVEIMTTNEPTMADVVESLTAAAATIVIPDLPPAWWFDEPTDVPEIGAITITDEGRMYGYLAPGGVAHRGLAKRTEAPTRNVDYTRWMNRPTRVMRSLGGDREEVATIAAGPITMNCGHVSPTGPMARNAAATLDAYDNSCSLFATACVGEDRKGNVWIAGAVLPDVTASQVARALACQLSGDWRPHRERQGWRELCAALLVPCPGFAISQRRATTSYRGESLVASVVPVNFASDVDAHDCGCSSPNYADTANAARVIAASVGRDKATRARELYLSVKS